jgi:hypothetical protein
VHAAEPQDAIPAEYQPAAPAPKKTATQKLAEIDWRNFRTRARIVGVHISDDGSEIWSHGIGMPRYPAAGARCTYEPLTGRLVFETDEYELVVRVPKAAQRHARAFAGQFNTWSKSGRLL